LKTIIYTFADGAISETEVSDALYAIIAEIERETENNDRRETRRHVSLEQAAERYDTEIADRRVELEADFMKRVDIAKLRTAIKTLAPSQKELVRKRFFERESITAIAKEYGVNRQSVQKRLKRIYRKLRKNF